MLWNTARMMQEQLSLKPRDYFIHMYAAILRTVEHLWPWVIVAAGPIKQVMLSYVRVKDVLQFQPSR